MAENLFDVARLHNAAEIHHYHAVADVANDVEVVRHKKHRHVGGAAQVVQQFEHLSLD